MSLINQMLKDLAKRSRSYSELRLMPQAYLARTSSFTRKKFWLVSGGLFSVIFLLIVPLTLNKSKKIPQRDVTDSIQKLVANSNSDQIPAYQNTATITGITLQTQNNITSLRLLMTQGALYQLNSFPDKNQLEIIVNHANIVADLPPINFIKSAINNIEMNATEEGDVKIILTINPAAEIKYLSLEGSARTPELHLDLTEGDIKISADSLSTNTNSYHKNFIKSLAPEFSAKLQYDRALNFYKEGRVDVAMGVLTDLLQKFPEYFPARESLAGFLMQVGEIDKASIVLDVGLHQDPAYLPFIQLRARIWAEQGNLTKALMLVRSINPSLKEHTDFYAFVAALYQQQGHYPLAAELYNQLLSINSSNGVWWMGLGISLENMGKIAEAQEAYQHADADNLDPAPRAFVKTRLNG